MVLTYLQLIGLPSIVVLILLVKLVLLRITVYDSLSTDTVMMFPFFVNN